MIKRVNKEINDIIPKKLVELNLHEDFSIFENQGIRISTDNTDNISVFVIDKKYLYTEYLVIQVNYHLVQDAYTKVF